MTCESTYNLTDEQVGQVCGVLSVGGDQETAAECIGCSPDELRRAISADPQLVKRVRRTRSAAELSHIRNIQEAGKDPKNWRASVWWLERRAPERYEKRAPEAITRRQLEGFLAILTHRLMEAFSNAADRQRVEALLTGMATSLDELLDREQLGEAADDAAGGTSPLAAESLEEANRELREIDDEENGDWE